MSGEVREQKRQLAVLWEKHSVQSNSGCVREAVQEDGENMLPLHRKTRKQPSFL